MKRFAPGDVAVPRWDIITMSNDDAAFLVRHDEALVVVAVPMPHSNVVAIIAGERLGWVAQGCLDRPA